MNTSRLCFYNKSVIPVCAQTLNGDGAGEGGHLNKISFYVQVSHLERVKVPLWRVPDQLDVVLRDVRGVDDVHGVRVKTILSLHGEGRDSARYGGQADLVYAPRRQVMEHHFSII